MTMTAEEMIAFLEDGHLFANLSGFGNPRALLTIRDYICTAHDNTLPIEMIPEGCTFNSLEISPGDYYECSISDKKGDCSYATAATPRAAMLAAIEQVKK